MRVGNPDSKYTYNPGQLEIDITNKQRERDEFKQKIIDLVLVDASKADLRYVDLISVLKELKEKYEF